MESSLIKKTNNSLIKNLMIIFIGIYLAVTPFDYTRNMGIFSDFTKIAMLGIIIFFIIDNLLSNKTEIRLKVSQKGIKKITITTFLFFLYMCLTIFISNVEISKTIEILSIFVQSSIFIFIVFNIRLEKKDIIKIENIWFILTGIFSLFMTGYNITNDERVALKIFNGNTDPNFYCATLIGPFLIGISKLMDKNVGKKRIGVVILVINMVLMIMISGSRGSLIGIIVALCVYIYIYYKEQHKLRKIFKVLLIIIFLVALLIPFIPDPTLERYSIEGIFSNGGSGRINIWKTTINYFRDSETNNKILGNGIGSYRYTAGEKIGFESHGHIFIRENMFSHNIIFTILIEGGIIGLIIMILLFKNILIEAYKKDNKISFYSVLGILVAGLFIDIIYLRILWTVIGYAILCIKSYDIGEVNEE